MILSKDTMERILDNKASSWVGSMAVLPLLLAIILLGTITYNIAPQTAPFIEKILTPPVVEKEEEISFDDMAASATPFETTFQEFESNELELFTIPEPTQDIPEIEPVREPVNTEIAMSETPDASAAIKNDTPTVDLPGVALNDPSSQVVDRSENDDLDASMRTATSGGPIQPATDSAAENQPGGAALGKDKSGDIEAGDSEQQAVVINRSQRQAGEGVGLNKPASQEKLDLTGWILGHPRTLPPAVAEALDFSRQKADRTSTGSVVDENGKLYEFYFLHRTQNNLLRILVVLGNQAFRIDLPDFYLEANHVKAGRVFRGPPPEDDPFAPGGVIEVALESVSAIPAEVPDMFQLVLDWLEIKGQE